MTGAAQPGPWLHAGATGVGYPRGHSGSAETASHRSGRLVLVRHGETTANIERLLDTQPPGAPLSEAGRAQAQEYGEALLRARPTALLLHSTARRAQETARLARRGRPGVPDPIEQQGLYEIQAGDLEGRNDREAHQRWGELFAEWLTGDPTMSRWGTESAADLLVRFLPVLGEVTVPEGPLARGDIHVVTHGAATRLVAAHLADVDGTFALTHPLPNTAAIILRPREGELAATTGDRIARGAWELDAWGVAVDGGTPASGTVQGLG